MAIADIPIDDCPPPDDVPLQGDPDARRTEIEVTADEHIVAARAIEALARRPNLYQRGGALVQIVTGASSLDAFCTSPKDLEHTFVRTPRIATIAPAYLRELASESCFFFRLSKKGEAVQCVPPGPVISAIHSRGHWPHIRPLEGVTETPLILPDGAIVGDPGYDPRSGMLVAPTCDWPGVPDEPNGDDVDVAIETLREPWADFPFASDAHRAAAIGAVLTPLARAAFTGPAPLSLFDANTRGAGKSLASDIVAEIATGRPMPRMAPARDDGEMEKRITALAIAGVNMILIDNVIGALGGASLDAALTCPGTWRGRVLGESRDYEGPLRAIWYATGNNVSPVGDTSRRVLHIRLESPDEHPEERTGFAHDPLLPWVRANRGRIVAAGLTLLRAYILAGKPAQKITRWGSFESWASLVPSAMVWAGLPDIGTTREALRAESDTEASALAGLVDGWADVAKHFGGRCTVAQALARLADAPAAHDVLRDALAELCSPPPGKLPSSKQVSAQLRRFKGRVVGGRAIVLWRNVQDRAVWMVRRAGEP